MIASDRSLVRVIAGCGLVVSLVIGFFERYYKPQALLLESSPDFPPIIGWIGWILALVSTLFILWMSIQDWRESEIKKES